MVHIISTLLRGFDYIDTPRNLAAKCEYLRTVVHLPVSVWQIQILSVM